MNEERVLALAGVFQGAALAHQLATEGRCDEAAYEATLASIFRIDASSVAAVYGGVGGVRRGLRTLVDQFEEQSREIQVMRMAITVLRVERSLTRQHALTDRLREGITAAQRQVEHFGLTHANVAARLAELYGSTLSTLRPRVMVTGNPPHLQQKATVDRVRAALLGSVRSAVLWRQIGGRQWQILVYRKQCAMLARGLLTGSTLDDGL
jgi:high frequency lysogenization protein